MSKLILIPTPIGNLDDITLRAIECIKDADLILCEDTRRSLKLMNHLEIKKPLKSFHKFNEHSKVEKVIIEIHEPLEKMHFINRFFLFLIKKYTINLGLVFITIPIQQSFKNYFFKG